MYFLTKGFNYRIFVATTKVNSSSLGPGAEPTHLHLQPKKAIVIFYSNIAYYAYLMVKENK